MKRIILLFGGLVLLCTLSYAQSSKQTDQHLLRRSLGDHLSKMASQEETLAAHSPTGSVSGQKSNGTTNLGAVYTGTIELIDFGFRSHNPILADHETGVVAIIHRENGPLSSNQTHYFQADLSTNAGMTFQSERGPIADSVRFNKYAQSIILYNPNQSSDPFQSHLIYNGYATVPGRAVVSGAFQFNNNLPLSPAATEQHLWDTLVLNAVNGITEGLPGEFWMLAVEFAPSGSGFSGDIFVFKGVWNAGINDVDWTIHNIVTANHVPSMFGGPTIQDTQIEFSPSGDIGWIYWLGDIGDPDSTLQAIFVQSTDGGATWGVPKEVDAGVEPWVSDSLTSAFTEFDSISGMQVPIGTGQATFNFDGDLTVDRSGNPHLAVIVANTATRQFPGGIGAYWFWHGYEKFLADVTIDPLTNNFTLDYIAPILTYEGQTASQVPYLVYNNHVEISRSPDGDYIFFSWIDSDTTMPGGLGFGAWTNNLPNLRVTARRMSDDRRTCIRRVTDGDDVWGNKMLYHALAPEAMINFTQFQMPIMGAKFQGAPHSDPADIYYFGRVTDLGFTPADFLAWDSVDVAWNVIGNCTPVVGLEDDALEDVLTLDCFPNPTSGHLALEIGSPYAARAQLSILNSLGQQVTPAQGLDLQEGKQRFQLDLAALSPGLYFVQIREGDQRLVERVIVQ